MVQRSAKLLKTVDCKPCRDEVKIRSCLALLQHATQAMYTSPVLSNLVRPGHAGKAIAAFALSPRQTMSSLTTEPFPPEDLRIVMTPEPVESPKPFFNHSSTFAAGSCKCRVIESTCDRHKRECVAQDGSSAIETATVTSDPSGMCIYAQFFEALMTSYCKPCTDLTKAKSGVALIEYATRVFCNKP